ncbi:hypothetical protein FORC31_p284 (plasmid) [Escherichia coli]|nr:hypothetical protein FORC31_p284 [Escherichia coli]
MVPCHAIQKNSASCDMLSNLSTGMQCMAMAKKKQQNKIQQHLWLRCCHLTTIMSR